MACTSCGEKPKKCNCHNRDFPSAVVEINNPEQLVLLRKVLMPSSLPEADNPPVIGKYRNVILQYEDTGHVYLYSSDGIPTAIEANIPQEILDKIADLEDGLEDETTARETADTRLETAISGLTDALATETTARTTADTAIRNDLTALAGRVTTAEGDINTIEGKIPNQATAQNQLADKNFVNSSIATNTANFIGTFNSVAELEAYTGPVTNNDYAFVIVTDAQGNTAYDRYKYNGDTQQWMFEYELNNSSFTAEQWAAINSGITSGNVTKLAGLADIKTIGSNLALDANGQLSGNYTHFTGATASTDGTQGLVPAPLAGDEDKFLKADGTWDTAGGGSGPTVVQTTGTSTTDVMSQNAVTSMVFADPSAGTKVRIGNTLAMTLSTDGVAIGKDVVAVGAYGTAVGSYSRAHGASSVALGQGAYARRQGSVAIGDNAYAEYAGEVAIGTTSTSTGYNNSNYRLLTGLYDPQGAHDAATKGYVDASNSYSLTETATGGTWVDGSPIYKKTISVGALPNATAKTVAHGITNLGYVIKIEGFAYDGTNTAPLPLTATNDAYNVQVSVNSTNITLVDGADRSDYATAYITLYYTKSA